MARASTFGAMRRTAQRGEPFAGFLAQHSVESTITTLLPVVTALPTHATRYFAQLSQAQRAERHEQRALSAAGRRDDDDDDDDDDDGVGGSNDVGDNDNADDGEKNERKRATFALPSDDSTVRVVLLVKDIAAVERALCAVLRTLAAIVRIGQ